MSSAHLVLVQGSSRTDTPRHGIVEQAVTLAIQAGFHIGQHVRIGRIHGHVVGYNIGNFGRYLGARYPLLVRTEFGVAKCSLREVAAA